MVDTTVSLQSSATSNTNASTAPTVQFRIVETYLQTSSDPDDVATELVRCINDGSCLQAPPVSQLRVETYVFILFAEIIFTATQIPWDHPWHQRLATLLIALRKQPVPPTEVCKEFEALGYGQLKWDVLPTFGSQIGESWGYKNRASQDVRRYSMKDCWSLQEWRSINSFLAVCVAKQVGIFPGGYSREGVRLLRDTLEFTRDLTVLEENIQSAALWILTAGKWLYENRSLQLMTFNWEEVADYKGPDGLSDERWKNWEGRFRELAIRTDLSEEARGWASKAADFMSGLE